MTNLSTANSLYLGSTAVDRVYLGSEKVWPMFSPAEFYADAEAGAWFDIGDPNAMLYGGTGVYPDPASGANVPTVLGKDQGFVEVDQGALGAANLSPTVTQSGNTFTFDNSPAGAQSTGGISLVRGRVYKQVVEVIGTGEVIVYLGAYSGTFSAGIHTLLLGSGGGSNYITRAGPAGFNGTVEILSIHEIVGVHAIQDDTSKSPRYEVEPQPGSRTTRYLLRDGVDDSLPAEMPNLGTDATAWYANEHGSYIQSGQTVNGTFETLRGVKTYAVGAIDRALTASEKMDLMPYLNLKRGGTKYSPEMLFYSGAIGDAWMPNREWCYTKSAGGLYELVTTSGDTCSRLVGMANVVDLDQDDQPKRPVYLEGGGLSWLGFDGVDDAMTSGPDFTVGNPWTFMTASTSVEGVGGTRNTIMEVGISNINGMAIGYRPNIPQLFTYSRLAAKGVGQNLKTANVSGYGKKIATVCFTNGNISIRSNGADFGTQSQTLTSETSGGAAISIGLGVVTGTSPGPLDFFGGIAVADERTSAEVEGIEAYLAKKIGIEI